MSMETKCDGCGKFVAVDTDDSLIFIGELLIVGWVVSGVFKYCPKCKHKTDEPVIVEKT